MLKLGKTKKTHRSYWSILGVTLSWDVLGYMNRTHMSIGGSLTGIVRNRNKHVVLGQKRVGLV